MILQAEYRMLGSIVATALALCTSAARAADLPAAGLNILDWPRMTSPAFGCFLERNLGHRDPRFNCTSRNLKPGDPCIDTANYYAGPEFPEALAPRVHPLATDIRLKFEHGEMQSVSVTLTGKFSERDVRQAFGLQGDAAQPQNISSISVQDCSLASTCLVLQGFEHMGAGDVDCPRQAIGAPARR